MSTARALQNDPRQATCVNVSDQIIVTRFHEGGLRARLSLVGPVLTVRPRGAQLAFAIEHQNWQVHHWCPVLLSRLINPMLPARLVLVVVCVCEWACRRISADQRASDHHLHQLQLIIPPYIFSPLSHLLCQIVVCCPGCLVFPSSFQFVFSWVVHSGFVTALRDSSSQHSSDHQSPSATILVL